MDTLAADQFRRSVTWQDALFRLVAPLPMCRLHRMKSGMSLYYAMLHGHCRPPTHASSNVFTIRISKARICKSAILHQLRMPRAPANTPTELRRRVATFARRELHKCRQSGVNQYPSGAGTGWHRQATMWSDSGYFASSRGDHAI
jgi:alkylated DNA repair dioxygenase AlkB